MMYAIQDHYYAKRDAAVPVGEWLDSISKEYQAVMMDKILVLGENGLELLGTKMLRSIKGNERDFYELRGGQCRIVLHFNRGRSEFVLLHGFLKKKQNERAEIKRARSLLQEYLG